MAYIDFFHFLNTILSMNTERGDNDPKVTDPRILKVLEWLKDEGIQYELHLHDSKEGVTSEDASEALGGVALGQILKSLLLQAKDGRFLGVIMAGNRKVSFGKIREIIGQKASFAKTEDILKQTGFERGGVPPFAFHFANIPAYVDKDLMNKSEVFGSAGSSTAGIKFSPAAFRKINYVIVDIGE